MAATSSRSEAGSRTSTSSPHDRIQRRISIGPATVAGVIEIRLWVLSWGDDVEVLEPASLRADVAATHARAAARYAGTTA